MINSYCKTFDSVTLKDKFYFNLYLEKKGNTPLEMCGDIDFQVKFPKDQMEENNG